MNSASILRTIHRLQNESAKQLHPKINEWLDTMRKAIVSDLRAKYVKATPTEIVAELTDWEWIENEGKRITKPAVLKIIGQAGDKAYKLLEIEGGFDVLNPRSVRLAETICAHMVREVSDETRKAIRWAVRDGIQHGKNMHEIAMEIRPRVGLTERQIKAVANYEEWLIENRPDLSVREIDRRVGVYERRKHRKRADMISRTESARAVSEGGLQAYDEAGVAKVRFLGAAGCCQICADMNGNEYTLDAASGVIPVHPL